MSHYKYSVKTNVDLDHRKLKQCVVIGNWLMTISVVAVTVFILMTYIFDEHIAIVNQIIAHIGTIFFAGVLKLGYVIRCVGAHGLGYRSF